MDPETNKNKSLSKEETKALLSLIEGSNIINNKKTNATNNKMKVEEWTRIANSFNANVGTCRRTPQQLRLKWENLKKNSRKRSTLVRMERIKTGGGPSGYIACDEILDRVASLLGSTVAGLPVLSGGDSEVQNVADDSGGSSGVVSEDTIYLNKPPTPMLLGDGPLAMESGNAVQTDLIGAGLPLDNTTIVHQKRSSRLSGVKRKLLLQSDDGRRARNEALTEYYKNKTKSLALNNTIQTVQYENIKLENENLKLENIKLKLELSKLQENNRNINDIKE